MSKYFWALLLEAEGSEQLDLVLKRVAEKCYSNGEGVAHKAYWWLELDARQAVRLGDARLLAALGRIGAKEVLLQRNLQGGSEMLEPCGRRQAAF